MSELRTLLIGISFGEQPRWHEGRLWFSDWGTREVIAVDLEGASGDGFVECADARCEAEGGHLD
jgi:hypothetical protein